MTCRAYREAGKRWTSVPTSSFALAAARSISHRPASKKARPPHFLRQKHNLNTPPDLVAHLVADLIGLYHLAQRREKGGRRSIAAPLEFYQGELKTGCRVTHAGWWLEQWLERRCIRPVGGGIFIATVPPTGIPAP